MKFSLNRETLLKPLQAVMSVVENRHTMAILANILLDADNGTLSLTATDLELELVAKTQAAIEQPGKITVPGRKLLDISRSLPEGANITLTHNASQVVVTSGKSRFQLSTLSAQEFPSVEGELGSTTLTLPQNTLAYLIKKTHFAMAQQDVRYFLNGMLLEIKNNNLRTVTTDGHRLATCVVPLDQDIPLTQVIIPRKAVLEMLRLLEESDQSVVLTFGKNHLRVELPDFVFTTKLLEGRYPDYNRVIPAEGQNTLTVDRKLYKQALSRTAILSNEKYRGVRLNLGEKRLVLMANNPEQEEAQDELEVQYQGDAIEIGFNVNYLLDVMGVLECDAVQMNLTNANSSALVRDPNNNDSVYVVMPIRL